MYIGKPIVVQSNLGSSVLAYLKKEFESLNLSSANKLIAMKKLLKSVFRIVC